MRKRISITVREDLLARVDADSGETSENNRSKAIERILEAYFSPSKIPAVILAGDERSLGGGAGSPLIKRIASSLRENGVKRAIVCTTLAVSPKIKEVLGNGESLGMEIEYSEQKEKSGTAAALRKVKSKLKGNFLLVYGDNFFDFDIGELVKFHTSSGADVTAALTTVKTPSDYGVVNLQGRFITKFNEKPKEAESHLVSVGIFAAGSGIFKSISDSAKSLEKDVFPDLCSKKRMAGCVLSGKWVPF